MTSYTQLIYDLFWSFVDIPRSTGLGSRHRMPQPLLQHLRRPGQSRSEEHSSGQNGPHSGAGQLPGFGSVHNFTLKLSFILET